MASWSPPRKTEGLVIFSGHSRKTVRCLPQIAPSFSFRNAGQSASGTTAIRRCNSEIREPFGGGFFGTSHWQGSGAVLLQICTGRNRQSIPIGAAGPWKRPLAAYVESLAWTTPSKRSVTRQPQMFLWCFRPLPITQCLSSLRLRM